ncbi:DNA-binding protein [Rhodobacter capsulatus]|uniref:Uncharacterized protein n=1 Tax=Rhodobacter capsulatus TaxID=1061 RepID=A0A1G7LPW0_RHOCA|nr:DNA-binding protein [Rhodobacter capsulatus]WER10640.1 DNA-binding protein [Rhodobacter capsulatus]SDF50989.1 hypothetical protein SAMN04244550_02353 [Rhodobacter capsulatus]
MTAAAPDLTCATAQELGDLLGVTPRRVRQLAEEGRLVKRGRGTFDTTQAVLGSIGAAVLGQDRKRGVPANVVAAVGWLSGFGGRVPAPVTAEDLAAWREGCARWGLTADEAAGLLAAAAALLGANAPQFKVSPQ